MDVAIDYSCRDAPTLMDFLHGPRCNEFLRLIVGPWGSGKSSACVIEILRRMIEHPRGYDGKRRSRCVVVRNTYRELEDTTIKTFEEWVRPELGRWRSGDNVFEVRFGDVEAEVWFRALDRPDHVGKLLSLEFTFFYLNEAKQIAKAIFDALQGRAGRYPRSDSIPPHAWYLPGLQPFWYGGWCDTNPPDTDHYLYRLFEEEKPTVDFEVRHRTTGDIVKLTRRYERWKQPGGRSAKAENVEHLPPGYYDTLCLGKDADWIRVNVDGEYGFVRDGKPVFPEFHDSRHVAEFPALAGEPLLVGMDFGLTPSAVLGQRDPKDGQLQIIDEFVSEDLGAVRFSRELARKLKTEYPGRPVRGWGDPAGAQRSQVDERTPFDVVQAAGLPVDPAPTNDFMLRREAVAGLLTRLTVGGREALVVHPRARVVRKALGGGYCYQRLKVSGDERYHDVPMKNAFSHPADALQYLCVGEGEDDRAIHGTREGARRRVVVPPKVKRAVGGVA